MSGRRERPSRAASRRARRRCSARRDSAARRRSMWSTRYACHQRRVTGRQRPARHARRMVAANRMNGSGLFRPTPTPLSVKSLNRWNRRCDARHPPLHLVPHATDSDEPTIRWLLVATSNPSIASVALSRRTVLSKTRCYGIVAGSSVCSCRHRRCVSLILFTRPAQTQGLGGAGTVQGTVKDPTGGVMQAVEVKISNPVTGLHANRDDRCGGPVTCSATCRRTRITSRSRRRDSRRSSATSTCGAAVPIDLDLTLALAGATSTVEVVGHAEDLLERDPTAHTDIDQSLIAKLPLESSSGLNQVITLASPGVVADSNGFFHPIGDHAQTQFSIDNQPITDQQSRLYSNQISPDAVQSMEVITGVAPAEYGDKSSLVVHIVTKSGLDQPKPTGSASFGYGSFKSPTGEVNIGAGSHTVGDFLSLSGLRDRSLPRSAGVRGAARHRQQPVALQSPRRSPGRRRHVAPERAGGASRASTCRTPTTRSRRRSIRTSRRSTSRPATRASSARRRCSRRTASSARTT